MTKGAQSISIDLLNELLQLDGVTGKLFWRPRLPRHFVSGRHTAEHRCANWNSQFAGSPAFYTMDLHGYFHGYIFRRVYSAARVVFALANGKWPDNHIDHINGIKSDNRPCNLRDVTRTENMRNRAVSTNSQTGVHGVSLHAGKYDAYITTDGRKRHLGRFKSIEDAAIARRSAEAANGYHINHGRKAA